MNKTAAFITGAAIGAGLMYVCDPDRGKRRRTIARDKLKSTARKTGLALERTAQDLSNHARGLAASVAAVFVEKEVTDDVLVARIRSKLGHIVSHPSAIEVSAENGHVSLRGNVLASEIHELLSTVWSMRGVRGVDHYLKLKKRVIESATKTEPQPASVK